jgi:hypothetical protein
MAEEAASQTLKEHEALRALLICGERKVPAATDRQPSTRCHIKLMPPMRRISGLSQAMQLWGNEWFWRTLPVLGTPACSSVFCSLEVPHERAPRRTAAAQFRALADALLDQIDTLVGAWLSGGRGG